MTIQSSLQSSEHSVGKCLWRSEVNACIRVVSTFSICAFPDEWGRLIAGRAIAADQRICIDLWPLRWLNGRVLQQHGETRVYPSSRASVWMAELSKEQVSPEMAVVCSVWVEVSECHKKYWGLTACILIPLYWFTFRFRSLQPCEVWWKWKFK